MSLFRRAPAGAEQLRQRLSRQEVLVAPGCFDALSARVIERAGLEATFLGGFAVAATRLGLPDTGLLSYGEMVDQGQDVCTAVSIPVIGDADTGYGNEVNVRRTLAGFARAGFACVMIEDQCWPKRCGHTSGIETVDQEEAISRVRAAVEARDDLGLDVLVLARTDAAGTEGFDEALRRAEAFAKLGADLTFIEAPKSELEMRRYCEIVPGHKTANMVEDGKTPWLLARGASGDRLFPGDLPAHPGPDEPRRNGEGGPESAERFRPGRESAIPGPPTHGRLRRLLEPGGALRRHVQSYHTA